MKINKNLGLMLIHKLWTSLAGLIIIAVLPLYLSVNELGYFYLFQSTLAVQALVELGITSITQTYISQNFINVNKEKLKENKEFEYLLKQIVSYYSVATILFFIFANLIFFYSANNILMSEKILYAWMLYSIFSSANLYLSYQFAILDGLNKISISSLIRITSSLSGIVVLIIVLNFDLSILSASAYQSALFIISIIGLKISGYQLNKICFGKIYIVTLMKKIYAFQKQLVFVWISGFLTFSLFVPLTMKYFGPQNAGKLGLTMAIMGGLMALSNTFVQVKMPTITHKLFNDENKKDALDLFKESLRNAIIFIMSATVILNIIIYYLNSSNIINIYMEKLLSKDLIIILSIHLIANVYCTALSLFSRGHGKEIFVKEYFTIAIITLLIMIVIINIEKTNFNIFLHASLMPFILLGPLLIRRKFKESFNYSLNIKTINN